MLVDRYILINFKATSKNLSGKPARIFGILYQKIISINQISQLYLIWNFEQALFYFQNQF